MRNTFILKRNTTAHIRVIVSNDEGNREDLTNSVLSLLITDRSANPVISKAVTSFEGIANSEAIIKILQSNSSPVAENKYFAYFELEKAPNLYRTASIPVLLDDFAATNLQGRLSLSSNLFVEYADFIPLPLSEPAGASVELIIP